MDKKRPDNESDGIRRHIFDIGITFSATLVSTFLSFLLTIILARHFGATDLGIYRLALTSYGIIMLFVASAIPAAMIKYVAECQNDCIKLNKLVSTGIIIAGIFGGICMIFLFFISDIVAELLHAPGLSGLLKILVVIIPFSLFTGVLNGYLNGMRLMRPLAISTVFQSVMIISLSLLFIQLNFGLQSIIISLVIASILNFLLLLYYVRIQFTFEWNSFVDTSKLLLCFGIPVIAANFVGQINSQLDNLFIGIYLTPADVGIYSIAWTLSTFIWLLPSAIQKITYPITSELWSEQKKAELCHMINLTLKYTTIIMIFGGLFLVFFGKSIIGIIFTEQFSPAYIPLVILLIGTIIRGVVISIGSTVAGIGKPGIDFITTLIMCITWIFFDITLIPIFGIIGTAVSATIALTIGTFSGLYYIKRYVSVEFDWKWYVKIFLFLVASLLFYTIASIAIIPHISGVATLILFFCGAYNWFLTEQDKLFFYRVLHSVKG
jgi:O-antigen/teichoic acid export membrane protein